MSEATLCTIVAEAACGESISYLGMYVMYDAEADDLIAVYGGITDETLPIVLEAGANIIVAGSAVFEGDITDNCKRFLAKMKTDSV